MPLNTEISKKLKAAQEFEYLNSKIVKSGKKSICLEISELI